VPRNAEWLKEKRLIVNPLMYLLKKIFPTTLHRFLKQVYSTRYNTNGNHSDPVNPPEWDQVAIHA
jgi:hypothetical protein